MTGQLPWQQRPFAIELEPDFHLWKPILASLAYYNDGDIEAAQDIGAPAIQALPQPSCCDFSRAEFSAPA